VLEAARAQFDTLQAQNSDMEGLRRYEQRIRNIKNSLEDQIHYLEEQARFVPSAYSDTINTSEPMPYLSNSIMNVSIFFY
jgi:hypothetical protein